MLKFKTNINCGSCKIAVSPYLDKIAENAWEVDTTTSEKVLTITSNIVTEQDIVNAIKEAGYSAEAISLNNS